MIIAAYVAKGWKTIGCRVNNVIFGNFENVSTFLAGPDLINHWLTGGKFPSSASR
jgi:hypothetical protein